MDKRYDVRRRAPLSNTKGMFTRKPLGHGSLRFLGLSLVEGPVSHLGCGVPLSIKGRFTLWTMKLSHGDLKALIGC